MSVRLTLQNDIWERYTADMAEQVLLKRLRLSRILLLMRSIHFRLSFQLMKSRGFKRIAGNSIVNRDDLIFSDRKWRRTNGSLVCCSEYIKNGINISLQFNAHCSYAHVLKYHVSDELSTRAVAAIANECVCVCVWEFFDNDAISGMM